MHPTHGGAASVSSGLYFGESLSGTEECETADETAVHFDDGALIVFEVVVCVVGGREDCDEFPVSKESVSFFANLMPSNDEFQVHFLHHFFHNVFPEDFWTFTPFFILLKAFNSQFRVRPQEIVDQRVVFNVHQGTGDIPDLLQPLQFVTQSSVHAQNPACSGVARVGGGEDSSLS